MQLRSRRLDRQRGFSLVEMICASAIILILAGVAIPVANTLVKQRKEMELRRALREIRRAIDDFNLALQTYPGMRQKMNTVNEDGFPEEIGWLYEGFDIGDAKGTKLKFLRRLPRDPITGKAEWATKSSRDRPEAHFSDGINIFDVHSKSDAIALDGTRYADW